VLGERADAGSGGVAKEAGLNEQRGPQKMKPPSTRISDSKVTITVHRVQTKINTYHDAKIPRGDFAPWAQW
jgi:hypothetical protein